MSDNKNVSFWKWMLVFMLVCNVALIATIWLKPSAEGMPGGHPPPPHHRGGGPTANFKEKLSLTDEQQEQLTRMAAQQRKKIDSLKKEARDVREAYFAHLSANDVQITENDSLATLLGTYHKYIEQQTYRHFRDIRAMLTDAQKTTFDGMIADVLRSLPEQPRFRGDRNGPAEPPPNRDDHRPPPPDNE